MLFAACSRNARVTDTPGAEIVRTLTHDGLERSYVVYIPESTDLTLPVPLVFVLHGGTGNAQSAQLMSGFNELAQANSFIVVYPNGTGRLSDDRLLTWNGGTCCGYAQQQNADDVGFIRAIVTNMAPVAAIDPKRIYATGMSNGGVLSHRLACEAADLFAAVAPVAGTLNFPGCNPSEPISVIAFHGTDDQHLPYDGGVGTESLTGVDFASVDDSIHFWTTFNRCETEPQNTSFGDISHDIWSECTDSVSVELYTIIGGGHAWPGGLRGREEADEPTQSIIASELIWQFFATHPKP
jgi:polyhydroxybutyrate depolymerase